MTFGCHLTCWYEARNWVCFYILFYRFLFLQLKAPTANKSALEPYDGKNNRQWNDNRHPKVFFTRILANENMIAQQRLCPSSATKLFEHYICVLVSWDEEVMSQLTSTGIYRSNYFTSAYKRKQSNWSQDQFSYEPLNPKKLPRVRKPCGMPSKFLPFSRATFFWHLKLNFSKNPKVH